MKSEIFRGLSQLTILLIISLLLVVRCGFFSVVHSDWELKYCKELFDWDTGVMTYNEAIRRFGEPNSAVDVEGKDIIVATWLKEISRKEWRYHYSGNVLLWSEFVTVFYKTKLHLYFNKSTKRMIDCDYWETEQGFW